MITEQQIQLLVEATIEAGTKAKQLRNQGLQVEHKADGSLVTNADKELDAFFHQVIRNKLQDSNIILSEEDVANGTNIVATNKPFWSIDPIDSTHSYVDNKSSYTVNLAFVDANNIPIFGIIHTPDNNTVWYGSLTYGAYKKVGNEPPKQIFTRKLKQEGAVLISSDEQVTPKALLQKLNIVEDLKMPSSVKFTYIAEGLADFYTRKQNKACDWDITPGHALIVAAGGKVVFQAPTTNFKYGKPPYLAPCLLAIGDKDYDPSTI
ncbi:Inositol monophosphatase family 7 [Candidatus Hepatincola sp. Av]